MKIFLGIALFVVLVFSGFPHGHFARAGEEEFSQKYRGEIAVAKAIDMIIRSARNKYTENVVEKLQKDGTGASVDHAHKKGYVPLPAQYEHALADDALKRQIKNKDEFFNFVLRSRWNLNSKQGLETDFEKKGWEYLIRQQEEALKAGIPLKKIQWKPFIRAESINGQEVLHYLSADTASSISCVVCHNEWEQKPEIKKLRKKQGVGAGKIFQMRELMGAHSINVTLDK
ncbi:MAG: DUF3365 domain-containing protein [Nitrospina sp.]|jgi:hypothetical protein|nr:DUF3365 domain-containing protein [Nitrospina sp.]